jgi:hypothetical protein
MFRGRRASILIVIVGTLAMVFAGGASSLTATGSPAVRVDDAEPALSGDFLTRAGEAALAVTGAGRVTDSEAGDEESFYEVQVTLQDGRHVDVQLDTAFRVVSRSSDARRDDG